METADRPGPGFGRLPAMTAASTAADRAFRHEVATFRTRDRRRLFPMHVHVGIPDGDRRRVEVPWPVPASYDVGVRLDLADALVEALLAEWASGVAAWGWLTRPGAPSLHDCDLAWLAAVRHAFEAHELALAGFRAVTRSGWLDVVTGDSRTWARLRI